MELIVKIAIKILLFNVLVLFLFSGCTRDVQNDIRSFEGRLEEWRIRLKMPAFSASIVKDNEILWAKGFGYADIDDQILATEKTIYHLASLTKPFASIILMQLVEQNKVNLEDPISKYGIDLSDAREYGMDLTSEEEIKVKHLLTHTAQGIPGSYYQYSGFLYGYIDDVIARSSGSSFAELLVQNITQPLHLVSTIPNISDSSNFSYTGLDASALSRQCASPYIIDSLYNIVEGEMEGYFGASAGLMSSALDMAAFSIAITNQALLNPDTWTQVFSPTISVDGDTLPYGYGWFIQNYKGMKIIWHYGYWNTNSSLIMLVPERGYNFVILANTNLLSRPFGLGGGDGNVFHSPFAIEFARTFLFEDMYPDINSDLSAQQLEEQILINKESDFEDLMILELFALASTYTTIGDKKNSAKFYSIYNDLFTKPLPDKLNQKSLITEITEIIDFANEVREFSLSDDSELFVFSIGEGFGSRMYDYGWIENAATGDTLWKMTMDKTSHAGGASKNRLVNTKIKLKRGDYNLHYISDDSHSFNQWNATPPDFAFYGIAIYKN